MPIPINDGQATATNYTDKTEKTVISRNASKVKTYIQRFLLLKHRVKSAIGSQDNKAKNNYSKSRLLTDKHDTVHRIMNIKNGFDAGTNSAPSLKNAAFQMTSNSPRRLSSQFALISNRNSRQDPIDLQNPDPPSQEPIPIEPEHLSG